MIKVSEQLYESIGDPAWVTTHAEEIRKLMPETWTHPTNINWLALGFKLKCLGMNWRSENDLAGLLAFLTRINLVQLHDGLIRRGPRVERSAARPLAEH